MFRFSLEIAKVIKLHTISIPRTLYFSKASGVIYSDTGMWRFVGLMYCPKVITSTPAALTFSIVLTTWSGVSPQPNIIDVLVRVPAGAYSLANFKTSIDCLKLARRSLTTLWSSSTVSILWARTSSPDTETLSTHVASPRKSGTAKVANLRRSKG